MSSPSRQVIDPLIYSYPESNEASAHSKPPSTSSALVPLASKIINSTTIQQTPGITGWTPLISRTISNELVSYNSTPSSKILHGGARPSVALGGSNDYDYPSLNLTPFLTHNLNLNNPNSAGNLSNNISFTPFYDKSIHLNDFFMDSPINHTPLKAETITPSKFVIAADMRPSSRKIRTNFDEESQKRSLTALDTPARQPYKKTSSTFKNDGGSENEEGFNGMDSKKFDGDGFLTPSKRNILGEMPANLLNKTPMKSVPLKNLYQTPKVVPNSSPSTVIMSSATKSPDHDGKDSLVPASPTPHKDNIEVTEPVMGIFSERKPPVKAADAKLNNRKPQKKQLGSMNRFQIVFTDVHTLMNNKKKKSLNTNLRSDKLDTNPDKRKGQMKVNKGKPPSPVNSYPHTLVSGAPTQQNSSTFHHSSSNLSTFQDFNSTMNTSKEFSTVGNNTTFNTTANNINCSSDQNSFDLLHGGIISTPNEKYVLENLFDDRSPQGLRQSSAGGTHPKHIDSLEHELPHKIRGSASHISGQQAHYQSQYLQHNYHRPHQEHHQRQRHSQQQQSYPQLSHQEQNQQSMTEFIMSTP